MYSIKFKISNSEVLIKKKLCIHYFLIGILRPAATYKRNFVVWGDHSSILNSGYMLYTAKVIFSETIFYTDEEYFVKFGRKLNIQSVVEQPEIYIVAKCADTIAEKLAYIDVRREDLKEMEVPLVINNVVLEDTMRFFQGMYLTFVSI